MAELGEKPPETAFAVPGQNRFHPLNPNQPQAPGTKPTYRLPSGQPIVRVNLAKIPGQAFPPRPLFPPPSDYWNGGGGIILKKSCNFLILDYQGGYEHPKPHHWAHPQAQQQWQGAYPSPVPPPGGGLSVGFIIDFYLLFCSCFHHHRLLLRHRHLQKMEQEATFPLRVI